MRDHVKLYSILAYIGPLWLIGLLHPPEKDDPRVKFHVGQGMVLTIVCFLLNFIFGIVNSILRVWLALDLWDFAWPVKLTIAGVRTLIGLVTVAVVLFFIIKGILNANEGKQEELPIIGHFAFYR